ncbi:MAG: hypothetical protein ACFFG0_45785 [Candidatus Thorarchaeota archaeon]
MQRFNSLGLERKLAKTDVYIFSITSPLEDGSFLLAIDGIKNIAMGIILTTTDIPLNDLLSPSTSMPSSDLGTNCKEEWILLIYP